VYPQTNQEKVKSYDPLKVQAMAQAINSSVKTSPQNLQSVFSESFQILE
jgi:hypothetical protein